MEGGGRRSGTERGRERLGGMRQGRGRKREGIKFT
jgi:hypothetical protein